VSSLFVAEVALISVEAEKLGEVGCGNANSPPGPEHAGALAEHEASIVVWHVLNDVLRRDVVKRRVAASKESASRGPGG
jgi:hypothetical protein